MTQHSQLRQCPRGERGFTMAVTMGIMLIASIVSIAAWQAARGDLIPSGENRDRKLAYAAAESGVSWYLAKLTTDPNYWTACDTGTTAGVPDPVNQKNVTGTGRKWKSVGKSGEKAAEFSVGLLPATGATCSTGDPAGTMLNTADGTFRIRSTGRYRGRLASIITTFKRQRFLDFLYFTNYETIDPVVNNGDPACANYRPLRPAGSCSVISFVTGDTVNGPLHTNDDIAICGTPRFGRTASDNIHVSGAAPGHDNYASSGCADTPNFVGTFRTAQRTLQMPPTNTELRELTTPGTTGQGYRLSGTQYIRFTGTTMTIDTPTGNPVANVPLPPNGVLYIDDAGCNPNGNTVQNMNYTESAGCGNVYVSGTVNRPLTIASARDIIVAPTGPTTNNDGSQFNPATAGNNRADANLIAAGTLNTTTQQLSGSVQIGLVAQGFVRVYHRVNDGNLASGVRSVRIDAAILSLDHSFITDNWDEGPVAGTLQVHGAIAQRFRGPVGINSGGTVVRGYVKDYWYDDRLRYRSPPFFLDPVNAAWGPARQNELLPPV